MATAAVSRMILPPMKCAGHKRDGSPCGRYAAPGTSVCSSHGANAPQVRAAASQRQALATMLGGTARPLWDQLLDACNTLDSAHREYKVRAQTEANENGGVLSPDTLERLLRSAERVLVASSAGLRTKAEELTTTQAHLDIELTARVLTSVVRQLLIPLGIAESTATQLVKWAFAVLLATRNGEDTPPVPVRLRSARTGGVQVWHPYLPPGPRPSDPPQLPCGSRWEIRYGASERDLFRRRHNVIRHRPGCGLRVDDPLPPGVTCPRCRAWDPYPFIELSPGVWGPAWDPTAPSRRHAEPPTRCFGLPYVYTLDERGESRFVPLPTVPTPADPAGRSPVSAQPAQQPRPGTRTPPGHPEPADPRRRAPRSRSAPAHSTSSAAPGRTSR